MHLSENNTDWFGYIFWDERGDVLFYLMGIFKNDKHGRKHWAKDVSNLKEYVSKRIEIRKVIYMPDKPWISSDSEAAFQTQWHWVTHDKHCYAAECYTVRQRCPKCSSFQY